ncbi:MAG TPA: hypothetical protein VGQ34_06730 [Sphingomicrobium sp.]|nr:hypothetical protein [Sphingomicrobium sp.]
MVQIIGLESGDRLKRRQVMDSQFFPFELDQTAPAKLLDRAVHMHGCEASCVGYIALGRRKIAGKSVRQSHRLQAQEHFTKEMGNSLQRGPSSDVHYPLAMNGFADEFLPPQRGRDIRMSDNEGSENLVANRRNLEPCNGAYRMIHTVEDEQIKVAQVAWNGEVYNLATPIIQLAVATCPSAKDEKQRARRIPLTDQVSLRLNRPR